MTSGGAGGTIRAGGVHRPATIEGTNLMAWTNPRTWVAAEDLTAALLNTHLRDNFDETAPAIATVAGRFIMTDGANSIVERNPSEDNVLTAQGSTSTSYTNLGTTGPVVTVTCGTAVYIAITCGLKNDTIGEISYAAVTVSGATTAAAVDSQALQFRSPAANYELAASFCYIHTGLTAGSNTFTMHYKVSGGGGTGEWRNRRLTVFPF